MSALASLADDTAFDNTLRQWRRIDWVVYAKAPFGGPAQVLAYLGRYTHRVAIANSRILAFDDRSVSFAWRDYRAHGQIKAMKLDAHEFIRRFLQHTLPDGFHRIRHYGFLANGRRAEKLALCRRLLSAEPAAQAAQAETHPLNVRALRRAARLDHGTRHDQQASNRVKVDRRHSASRRCEG